MFKGFRDFILRGNVLDLAVAVIIGAAFTAIINSLVGDIINPFIAAIFGKPDFSAVVFHVGTGVIKIGNFLNAIIAFLLVALAVYFFIVVPANALMKRFHKDAPATTKPCPECLTAIPVAARRCSACGQPVAV
jgi:large conductance mechanosensitive channel